MRRELRRLGQTAAFVGASLWASTLAAEQPPPPAPAAAPAAVQPGNEFRADGVPLSKPEGEPELRILPIDLATALQYSGSRPIDVQLAHERVRGAGAALLQANALWLPSITIGGDYFRHDGDIQDSSGTIEDN